ncbi:MAG: hypothetical protein JXR77_03250, partial [Lentisphaeria bacterium]|nr:hypothetical protein [Lentisphaeria bacterium]
LSWDGGDAAGRTVPEGEYVWSMAGAGGQVEAAGEVTVTMRAGPENPGLGLCGEFVLTVSEGTTELEHDHTISANHTYSLRLRTGADKTTAYYSNYSSGGIEQALIPVTPGTTVRFSARIRSDLTAGEAAIALAFFTDHRSWSFLPGRSPSGENSEPVTGARDWAEVAVTGEVPPDAHSAVLFLRLRQAVGTAWFDDLRLEEVPR